MAGDMDYQFPQQLFPMFYNIGPPNSVLKHCAGNWGSYDRVRPQVGSGDLSSWTFTSRHQVRGETWCHTEPVPVPLLYPKHSFQWPVMPPDSMDCIEHMQNFFMDHSQDAFGCMGEILGENFSFKPGVAKKYRKGTISIWKMRNFIDKLSIKKCQLSYTSKSLDRYSALLWDVVHGIPPKLLGALLHEELMEQRDRMLFFEGATGGALAFVPFRQNGGGGGGGSSQQGCLLYGGNRGMDCLNFHKVELQHQRGSPSCVDAGSNIPFSFQLKGPVRQISATSLLHNCCVAVRSDHLCGVWRFSETDEPRPLQVVETKELATCVAVSPHILGEVLVASESGAVKLWTVGKGIQKVREEEQNLYFNAKSSWRWCEFSAHPRVILYADRTGVELTDIRMNPVLGHTLFPISGTSECCSGERLILSRYLGDAHPFHHLVTTQYSAYIMDERFPAVPMLKWDHLMQSPPMFCHVIPAFDSPGSGSDGQRSTKVLLGSQRSQEVTLLQYSGGRAEACSSRGPPQALHRPIDSLKHLPVQIPHRLEMAENRLSSAAAGLTCIQKKGAGEESMCVLQLTEAGDIFYQILEPEQPGDSDGPMAREEAWSKPTQDEATGGGAAKPLQAACRLVASDTSSDEDIIAPTQDLTAQRFVAETPERKQRIYSSSSSEESESILKRRYVKMLGLEIVDNESKVDNANRADAAGGEGGVRENNAGNTPEPVDVGEGTDKSHKKLVTLSDATLGRWKHWLQKLIRKSRAKESCPHTAQHLTVNAEDLLRLSDAEARDPTEEERVQSLRRDMRACMANRSLLINRAVSGSLEAPDAVPLPNVVDTDVWRDDLSQRLTVSWQGQDAWQAWWKEKLGLNKEEKLAALKRKRRREKEAKRASSRRLELSGSFTPSVSYQSELDDFSDLSGWSSSAGLGAWSENESGGPGLDVSGERRTPRAETPSSAQSGTLVPTPTATPRRTVDIQGDRQAPSSSRVPSSSQMSKPDATPTSQRWSRRQADYLHSLFSEDEPSQQSSHLPEDADGETPPPPPPAAAFSQLRSSQSSSQSVLRADLSQDNPASSRLSQSQSSQGRPRLPQASQPKKKSRMGF